MEYLEIATSFIIGLGLLFLSCWLFRAKMKWHIRLLLSAVMGAVMLICFNVFGIVALPLNPLNAFIVGFLGIFGAGLLFVILVVF